MPERSAERHRRAALRTLVLVASVLVLAPLVAAGCGEDAGERAAEETVTVTEAATETETVTATQTVTETVVEDGPGASAPAGGAASLVRFAGNGDRILPPVQARRAGAMLRWRNDGEVFSLFSQEGVIVDSVGARGETFLPAGRHLLEVVASGSWVIEIENARRAR